MGLQQCWVRHMETNPLLAVRGLHAGYGEAEILCGVDLAVNRGEIVAVLGSNGVGKTTLNRTISGILRARAGSIYFDGAEVVREKPPAIVARGLIHVPEGRRIFPNLSVRENFLISGAIAVQAPGACKTGSVYLKSFRAFMSAAISAPTPSQVVSSRCSP